jgi:hypothetical protein
VERLLVIEDTESDFQERGAIASKTPLPIVFGVTRNSAAASFGLTRETLRPVS